MITRDDCATVAWPGAHGRHEIGTDSHFTVNDVCSIMRIERHTVYKLIDAGLLPAKKVNARLVYIPREAVRSLLAPLDSDGSREKT